MVGQYAHPTRRPLPASPFTAKRKSAKIWHENNLSSDHGGHLRRWPDVPNTPKIRRPQTTANPTPTTSPIFPSGASKETAPIGPSRGSASTSGELRPHAKADANQAPSVRLGWTDQGLAFLVTVHDTTPIEADDDKLWLHDSVELMVSDATIPAQHFWLLVAPGMDPLHPQSPGPSPICATDKTSPPNLTATVASAKTDDGYTVEGLLPFANLNMTGQPGAELGLQICVNDRISQRDRMLYRWVPTDEALEHPKLYRHVRLAQQPSPPITLAANGEYVGRRALQIRINERPGRGTKPSPYWTITKTGDRRSPQNSGPGRIEINLPMPADDQAYGPLTVTRDSKEMARIDLGPARIARAIPPRRGIPLQHLSLRGVWFSGGDYLDPLRRGRCRRTLHPSHQVLRCRFS